jgi:ribose transport system substrate-binding protein
MNRIDFQRLSRMALILIIAVSVVTCVTIPKGFSQEARYQLDKDTAFDVFLKKHAWLEWWNNAPTIMQYKKDPPYKVGYITSWRGNPWQEVNIAEFTREVERSPLITDYVHMDSAGSVDTEISNLRDMFTMWKAGKLNAIIVDPLDAMALADTVAEIYDAGCPIILFNNAVNSTKYNCYVGNDPWSFGTLSAEWLAKEMGYKGKVLFFRGLKGYPIDLGRSGGGLSVLEKYPGIKIAAIEYADWSYDKAKKKFISMVAAHPQFDAIYSVGGQMSNAITDAMLELGMDPSKYLHASEDQNGFMQKCIKHNIKAYASCHPSIASAISVVLMEMLLQGYPVPKMYFYPTPGIPSERFKDYVRPDAPEGIFVFTPLSDTLLNKIIK